MSELKQVGDDASDLMQAIRLYAFSFDECIEELGKMSDPPLSKSAVNHRIRRLMEIAERIEREYAEGGTKG